MLNVYEYHTKPESLADYDNSWKISVDYAVDYLFEHPGHVGATKRVTTDPKAILRYVWGTRKPFPEGLAALVAKGINNYLIKYYAAINERSPKLEKELLQNKDVVSIELYRRLVIGGEWAEADKILNNHEHETAIILQFAKSLDNINYYREVGGEDQLHYEAERSADGNIVVHDADNDEILGHIVKSGNRYILYHGEHMIEDYEFSDLDDEVLTDFIHVLSGW